MAGNAVEVTGVPNTLSDDRMNDKLTIHFLRPRNGGGEVKRVLYPSELSGQAFVIFEEAAVAARVMCRTHVLELENNRFTLSVKAADRPEVDMPVEATLNMRLFTDNKEVRRLIKSHGLKVTENRHDQLRVQGAFFQLRDAKAELQRLLQQETEPANRLPSPQVNGRDHSLGAIAKSTDRKLYDTDPTTEYTRNPTSLSPRVYGSPNGTNSPREYGSSPSPRATPSHRLSFLADRDVLRYAQCFKRKDIDLILLNHNTKMDVKMADSADLSDVILEGRKSQATMEKMQDLLAEVTSTIRTQEISLQRLDHDSLVKVSKLIQQYKDDFPLVSVNQVGDILRLVGPSRDSYTLKQLILGQPLDLPPAAPERGRSINRDVKVRRSCSLPRTPKRNDSSPARVNWDPNPNSSDPSKFLEGLPSAGAAQGTGALPAVVSSSPTRRSHSETREKNKEKREQSEVQRRDMKEPAPPSGPKSQIAKFQKLMRNALPQNAHDFKKKMQNSKKK